MSDKPVTTDEATAESAIALESRIRKEISPLHEISPEVESLSEPTVFSLCAGPDGSIWIGHLGFIRLVSRENGTILTTVKCREKEHGTFACCYIACLSTGDAVASYGASPYVDKITCDGQRMDFTDVSPHRSYDIAVTQENNVIICINDGSLLVLSETAQRIRRISNLNFAEPLCNPCAYNYLALKGSEFVTHSVSSGKFTVIDGLLTPTVISTFKVLDKDGNSVRQQIEAPQTICIKAYICDDHGNIVATNRDHDIFVLTITGELKEVYSLPHDRIRSMSCVCENNLLIGTYDGKIKAITFLE